MSTERPILFKTEMVRAILAGKKTQTRRVIKPQPDGDITKIVRTARGTWLTYMKDKYGQEDEITCPYGEPGDFLWVRETWTRCDDSKGEPFIYWADTNERGMCPKCDNDYVWKPSIFMPREACRLRLEIRKIRVEPVQLITEEDAEAEGANWMRGHNEEAPFSYPCFPYRKAFSRGWDKINAKRGFGWEANPWLWVIDFPRAT